MSLLMPSFPSTWVGLTSSKIYQNCDKEKHGKNDWSSLANPYDYYLITPILLRDEGIVHLPQSVYHSYVLTVQKSGPQILNHSESI